MSQFITAKQALVELGSLVENSRIPLQKQLGIRVHMRHKHFQFVCRPSVVRTRNGQKKICNSSFNVTTNRFIRITFQPTDFNFVPRRNLNHFGHKKRQSVLLRQMIHKAPLSAQGTDFLGLASGFLSLLEVRL